MQGDSRIMMHMIVLHFHLCMQKKSIVPVELFDYTKAFDHIDNSVVFRELTDIRWMADLHLKLLQNVWGM